MPDHRQRIGHRTHNPVGEWPHVRGDGKFAGEESARSTQEVGGRRLRPIVLERRRHTITNPVDGLEHVWECNPQIAQERRVGPGPHQIVEVDGHGEKAFRPHRRTSPHVATGTNEM